MPAVPLDAVSDIPAQEFEPWRKKPLCANCQFSEIDPDDGKLYCHEDSARSQLVLGEVRSGLTLRRPGQPEEPTASIKVLANLAYWPQIRPEWSCWKHPDRQPERRRIESAALQK